MSEEDVVERELGSEVEDEDDEEELEVEVPREVGTETPEYEIRKDGSRAYFAKHDDDPAREKAEANIPARETGAPKKEN